MLRRVCWESWWMRVGSCEGFCFFLVNYYCFLWYIHKRLCFVGQMNDALENQKEEVDIAILQPWSVHTSLVISPS